MKKREFFWLSKLLLALIIILFFSFIALNNIFQFNTSYMQEEKEELHQRFTKEYKKISE